MSILNRTSLTPSDKFNVISKSVNCQVRGTISSLSDEYGLSRKTLYQTREAALEALHTLAFDTDEADYIEFQGWNEVEQRKDAVVEM